MTMNPYVCCFPGCCIVIESTHVACLDHWKTVPKNIRSEVQMRRMGWRDRAAARDYLRDWFLFELRKKLPPVVLPAKKAVPPAAASRDIQCRTVQPLQPRSPLASLLKMFDSVLDDMEATL